MEEYQNPQSVHNRVLHPRWYSHSNPGRRYLPPPDMQTEFSAVSTARLAWPVDTTASLSEGDPYLKASGSSLVGGTQTASIDGGTVLAAVLALCVFIGLAIWAAVTIQSELRDEEPDAVEEAEAAAALHFQQFGGLRSSLDVSQRDTTKQEPNGEISYRTRRPPQGKRSPIEWGHYGLARTLASTPRVGRNKDITRLTTNIEIEYTGEPVEPWFSESDGTTLAPSARRARRRRHRRLRKKPGRRSSRSGPTKRAPQRSHVRRHATALVDHIEKATSALAGEDVAR